MPRTLYRGLLVSASCLVLIVVAAVVWLWVAAVRALPPTEGFSIVQGVEAPVTIIRDRHGVPTITAASEGDAYFALGYTHAQDRLFQMELMRRQGQGRLAEIIGRPAVDTDRTMRTFGLYRRAQQDYEGFDTATRQAFERYTAGVNAWIESGHPLPLEFALLWFRPEPWRPADSLVWQKIMGLQLSGNWDEELSYAALVAKLGSEKAGLLSSPPGAKDPSTMAADAGLFRNLKVDRLHAALTRVIEPTLASNVWVVPGHRSQSGKPILANDPHLGFQSPSIWYFARIKTPNFEISGATIPGVPLHMLGHNTHVAWGLTTTHSDTSDLFIEKVAADGKTYETPAGPQEFMARTETIAVRFSDPVTITVRESRHGPIISDVMRPVPGAPSLAPEPYVLALSAALLQPDDRSAEGVFRMNHARDRDGFIQALRLFHAPHQNMMFADSTGAFGYYAPGRVPIRAAGDGMVPVPGWDGAHEWTGWIPFEELPRATETSDAILVNANNKMVDDTYPYLIAATWPDASRARRIIEVLEPQREVTVDMTTALQLDVMSIAAREMLPLLAARTRPATPQEKELLDLMTAWTGQMDASRFEPLAFAIWTERLQAALVGDELGDLRRSFRRARPDLLRFILTRDQTWCDDIGTSEKESCESQVSAAWTQTVAWLTTQNENAAGLRWGDYHIAAFGHLLFGNFPVIRNLGMLRISTGGDDFTVNRGSFSSTMTDPPFRHMHGVSLRAIYDLNDLSHSRFALAGGQSGHLMSEDYGSLLEAWGAGRYFTFAEPEETEGRRLTLQPAR